MNTLFYVLLLTAAAIAGLWYIGRKPYKHRRVPQANLNTYFEALLNRGFNGGVLIIEIPGSPLFLQFSKYIFRDGHVGLRFVFPLAPWSESYYEQVCRELSKRGFDLVTLPTSKGQVSEFLTVDLKQNIAEAVNVARLVIQSVYRLKEDQTLELYFHNVSPKNERIGFV